MTTVAVYPRLGHSNETITRGSTTAISINVIEKHSKILKEIADIKAENPDLYLALAKD
jgi:hypothetical protein